MSEDKYLVTLCCSMDEVPVRLFGTEDQVKDFCRETLPIGPRDDRWTKDHPAAGAIKSYDCDFSCVYGWNCHKIVDGVPVAKVNLWGDPTQPLTDDEVSRLSAEGLETQIPEGPLFPVKPLYLYFFNTRREDQAAGTVFLDTAVIAAEGEVEARNIWDDADIVVNGNGCVIPDLRTVEVTQIGTAADPNLEDRWVAWTTDENWS